MGVPANLNTKCDVGRHRDREVASKKGGGNINHHFLSHFKGPGWVGRRKGSCLSERTQWTKMFEDNRVQKFR